VGDHEHRLLRLAHDAHQLVLDGAARQRIQRAKRLVQQQHLGLDGKGARNAHALLHATRQLRRLLVDGRQQAHHAHKLFHMRIDLGARPVGPARLHGKGDVLAHREPGHERMALEHHAALQAGARHLAAVHEHMAAGGRVQPGQHVQDGGLAATRVADDADELAAGEREADTSANTGLAGTKALASPSIFRKPCMAGSFFGAVASTARWSSMLRWITGQARDDTSLHIGHQLLQLAEHQVQQHAHHADHPMAKITLVSDRLFHSFHTK
jgi:hypothetical protein